MPIWLKILIVVGVVGTVLTGIAAYFTESSNNVVQGQIEAIQKNRLTEAYYGFTSSEFKKSTSLEQFKEFIKPLLPILSTSAAFSEYPLDNDNKVIRVTFDNNDHPVILDYRLIRQEGKWKIFNIRFLGEERDNLPTPAINEPDSPVRNFLDLLKLKKVDDAYEMTTSKQFKETISLKIFQDFIESIEIFSDFASYEILPTVWEKQFALVQTLIHKNSHLSHVQFLILVEDNEWKIRGIEILSSDALNAFDEKKSEELLKPIRLFFNEIKKGDYRKAYENATAENFQQVTTFEEFTDFLKSSPFLEKNAKINFYKIAFDNNIAIVSSEISEETTQIHNVQFFLTQEKGGWKIVHIKILDDSPNTQNAFLGK